VAILDTEGNIIKLSSKRAENRSEIINYILKFGKPVLVASDVNPLPKNIEKISTSLGCEAYYPEVSLSNLEKAKMIKKYKEEIKNSHQKDALAAGIKAFRNYHSLFLKVEEILEKLDRIDLFDNVVERILRKKNENIADSVRKILKKEIK
jgi:predicted RNase H-like nuclease (RuvC/YqgF family)